MRVEITQQINKKRGQVGAIFKQDKGTINIK